MPDSSDVSGRSVDSGPTDRVVRRYRSLAGDRAGLLVAVSGGADSVALLCLLHELREPLGIARLGVLHVNHGLRGGESDGDERFVADLADRLGCPLFSKRLTGRSLHEPGMEEWARGERYRFFLETMRREGYDHVATGHTADDQAETVLLRILRGSALRGLRGILPARGDGVIRPIIDLERKEIETWLSQRGIGFRNDSSNEDRSFRRNRIRHELLPELESREPGSRALLRQIAENSAELVSRMEPGIEAWISRFVQQSPGSFVIDRAGLEDELHCCEALVRLFERYGIPVDSAKIGAIPQNGHLTGREFLLPGGAWRYYPARDSILFSSGAAIAPFGFPLALPGVTECRDGFGSALRFTAALEPEPVAVDNLPRDNLTVVLDLDSCGEPLVFRSCVPGDRFFPLGAGHPVDLNAYLSGQGVGRIERRSAGVVESPAAGIVWIPGIQISHAARVTGASKRVVRIELRKKNSGKQG